jgi:hypothetical protein
MNTNFVYRWSTRIWVNPQENNLILHVPKCSYQAYHFQPGKPFETKEDVRDSSTSFLLLVQLVTDVGLTSMAGSFPLPLSDVPESDREVPEASWELESSRIVLSPCGPSLLSWLDDTDAFMFLVGEGEWAGEMNEAGNEFVFCSKGGDCEREDPCLRCCGMATGRPGPLETPPDGKNTPVPVLGAREGGRGLGMADHGAWGITAVGAYVLEWFTATGGKSGFNLELATEGILGRTWATLGSLTVGTGSTPETSPKIWGFEFEKLEPLAPCVGRWVLNAGGHEDNETGGNPAAGCGKLAIWGGTLDVLFGSSFPSIMEIRFAGEEERACLAMSALLPWSTNTEPAGRERWKAPLKSPGASMAREWPKTREHSDSNVSV